MRDFEKCINVNSDQLTNMSCSKCVKCNEKDTIYGFVQANSTADIVRTTKNKRYSSSISSEHKIIVSPNHCTTAFIIFLSK